MENWSSIETKRSFFKENYFSIDNKSDLIDFIDRFKRNENFIYRGISQWSYKNYSSIQRFYNSTSFRFEIEYISDLFLKQTQLWKNQRITNYLSEKGVARDNTLAYLSFMQHYGVPTPLIDFSYDLNTALYFASKHVNNNEDRYFSIYIMPKNEPVFGIDSLLNFLKSKISFPADRLNLNGYLPYTMFRYKEVIYAIEDAVGNSKILTKNNPNITRQNGLFILNKYLDLSLEEALEKLYQELYSKSLPLYCFDISQSLLPLVNEYLPKNISEIFDPKLEEQKIEEIHQLFGDLKTEFEQLKITRSPNLEDYELLNGVDIMPLYSELMQLSLEISTQGEMNDLEGKRLRRGALFIKIHELEEALNDFTVLLSNSTSPKILSELFFHLTFIPNIDLFGTIEDKLPIVLTFIDENENCSPSINYYTGIVLSRIDNIERALVECDRCIAKKSSIAAPYNLKASILLKQGRFEEALSNCEKAIEIAPTDENIIKNLIKCRYSVVFKENKI